MSRSTTTYTFVFSREPRIISVHGTALGQDQYETLFLDESGSHHSNNIVARHQAGIRGKVNYNGSGFLTRFP